MTKEILEQLLAEKKYKLIHEELSQYNPVDLALLLSELEAEDLVRAFRVIEKERAAEAFSYMDNDLREVLVSLFTKQEIKEILDAMFTDDAVDFLSDMPANVVSQLLQIVDSETRSDINHLLNYPESSVGSIMTLEFVELNPDMTVKDALEKIRLTGINSETVYTCYVVQKHKLLGTVSAKDLMISDSDVIISNLMDDNVICVNTVDDREFAANLFRKYDLIALPVVDSEGCIVGIVTFDDAIDVLTEEVTEDMNKMAGMTSSDAPYLKTSVWSHAKHRIPWLMMLMFSASITGLILAKYENAFSLMPVLVTFIPMLSSTGGNCGSQSATLIIRGLSVDEIHFSDTFKVIFKELFVSIIVGLVLAVANGLRIFIFYKDLKLALVISLSLLFTIIVAKLFGCLLPVFAKKIKLDPALLASPTISTIIDVVSMIIYFGIATRFFNI